MIPTWRNAGSSSSARSASSAASGASPCPSSSSPRQPYRRSVNDCVAIAPTPGRAHGTAAPVLNACDCTATPSSPVEGSRATIEYVTPMNLAVHAHRDRAHVPGTVSLHRDEAALASVDEDRI